MKESTKTIKAKIEDLYQEIDTTDDPDTIRAKGKEIITLESKLQKRTKINTK